MFHHRNRAETKCTQTRCASYRGRTLQFIDRKWRENQLHTTAAFVETFVEGQDAELRQRFSRSCKFLNLEATVGSARFAVSGVCARLRAGTRVPYVSKSEKGRNGGP
jgi:hypothetical protein